MGENRLSDAVSAFSKQFARFSKADAKRTETTREDEILQSKVNSGERSRRQAVCQNYKIYKDPFGAFGTASPRAHAINADEQNLLKAYKLHKAVFAATKEHGDDETFVSSFSIESPIAKKTTYTFGGQFMYLSCWLKFEQGATDFVPILQESNGAWQLSFVAAETYRYERADAELVSIVKECFYS